VITELKVGEALVSVLDPQGAPTPVERAFIYPPHSRLTPLSPEERSRITQGSILFGHYEKEVDRESAYEKLKGRAERQKMEAQEVAAEKSRGKEKPSEVTKIVGAMAQSAAHAIGSQIGRQIIRGVLGSLFGSGRKR
jgi:hypothetical protein